MTIRCNNGEKSTRPGRLAVMPRFCPNYRNVEMCASSFFLSHLTHCYTWPPPVHCMCKCLQKETWELQHGNAHYTLTGTLTLWIWASGTHIHLNAVAGHIFLPKQCWWSLCMPVRIAVFITALSWQQNAYTVTLMPSCQVNIRIWSDLTCQWAWCMLCNLDGKVLEVHHCLFSEALLLSVLKQMMHRLIQSEVSMKKK